MDDLLQKLRYDYPDLTIEASSSPCWSPQDNKVFYDMASDEKGIWGLLHEIGHARLGHASFTSDMDLLQKEAAAWDAARKLGETYDILIQVDHIEDCMDTYRDWLHQRSTCPQCHAKGTQQPRSRHYVCLNCHKAWSVTSSRFCRPYRRSV